MMLERRIEREGGFLGFGSKKKKPLRQVDDEKLASLARNIVSQSGQRNTTYWGEFGGLYEKLEKEGVDVSKHAPKYNAYKPKEPEQTPQQQRQTPQNKT